MKIQRLRESLRGSLTLEYLLQRSQSGWRPVAVEWERELEGEETTPGSGLQEVPFGLRVAADHVHLEDDPEEMLILKLLAELIVQDFSFPRMAQAINESGFRTRDALAWDAVAVFKILPRLMEVAPQLFSSAEWAQRKQQLAKVAWNS